MRVLPTVGALERSAALAAEATERAHRVGHLPSLADTLIGCCTQAWLVRDTEAMRRRSADLVELAEAHGFPYYVSRARCNEGWVAVEEGRVAEGIGLIAGNLAFLRRAGNVLHTCQAEAMLSDAHLVAGDPDAALAHVGEALRIAARTGEAWLSADLHRRLGGILLRGAGGDATRAEERFRRALKIARSQAARLWELRAARDLARLCRDQGRLAEARRLLAPVYASFTEGFSFPDLVEARALLDELGAAPARGRDRPRDEARTPRGPDRLREPAPER